MKDILELLVLLEALTITVCSQPYQVDSERKCRNETSEYLHEGSNLCCEKCRPGWRMERECSATHQSVCQRCPPGQQRESWNYAKNCFTCHRCKSNKGLQIALNCSSTMNSRCKCLPGRYCIMEFDDPYCTECTKYKPCKVGYGVSIPGTANSDVKCKQCPSGTYSNTVSYIDPCQPHTTCSGTAVLRKGNATADTVCEWQTFTIQSTAASKTMGAVIANPESTTPRELTDSTQSVRPSVSEEAVSPSAKSPPPTTEPATELAAVIASVIGSLLILIGLMLLCICRQFRKKDPARLHPKVDTNGNCESGDKINQNYLEESQLTSLTVASPEQQCLLQKGEASSDHSQCSNNTETLTRTDGYSSHDSISPLQSTSALYNPHSGLSEPMTLLSNTEPIPPLSSILTQSSSQPTSPQIISPQVNVNITLHIENGSCGTPSFMPSDLMQAECKLPFGEEEESISTPQQEAGKQLLMSVQESHSS